MAMNDVLNVLSRFERLFGTEIGVNAVTLKNVFSKPDGICVI